MKALHGYFLIVLTYIRTSLFNAYTYEYVHDPHENKLKLRRGKEKHEMKKGGATVEKKSVYEFKTTYLLVSRKR